MPLRHFLTATAASAVLTSCASAPAPAPQPGSSASVGTYSAGVKRWTATLNPSQSYSSTMAGSQHQNAHGRVELVVSPNSPNLTHVTLTVTVSAEPGSDLGWGVNPGPCGSSSPPVLSASMFRPIQTSANGQGSVDATIPFVLSEMATYHLNVYRRGGIQLSDVITCGELRLQP